MVFASAKQRRAFFATGNFKRSPRTPSGISGRTAFSYKDGRNLGKFKNLKDVFRKFPSEKKAFNTVMRFRQRTGVQVNNLKDIKSQKSKTNINRRWDR